jgi:hypothetical protein
MLYDLRNTRALFGSEFPGLIVREVGRRDYTKFPVVRPCRLLPAHITRSGLLFHCFVAQEGR